MQRIAVESKTGMIGIGYQPETKTLEIEFKSRKEGVPNGVYHYAEFTMADMDAFTAAESKGSHFLKVIKPKFACTKQKEEANGATGA